MSFHMNFNTLFWSEGFWTLGTCERSYSAMIGTFHNHCMWVLIHGSHQNCQFLFCVFIITIIGQNIAFGFYMRFEWTYREKMFLNSDHTQMTCLLCEALKAFSMRVDVLPHSSHVQLLSSWSFILWNRNNFLDGYEFPQF